MELLKLAIIFGLLLLFLGLKKPLDLVMTGAALLLGIFFTMPLKTFLLAVGRSLVSYDTVATLLIIWLVMLLEGLMSRQGHLQRILEAWEALFHNRRVNLIAMPMIVGFLPSAGGALFSAPMVEQAAQGQELSPERKALINIYYRHVMELFFPTYPGILMLASVSGYPVTRLSLLLLPLAVLVLLLGLVLVRDVARGEKPARPGPLPRRIFRAVFTLWPFLLMIALISVARLEVWLAVGLTLLTLLLVSRPPLRELPRIFRQCTRWRLLTALIAVLVFKDILYACGAVEQLPAIIGRLPIPPLLTFSFLAIVIGLLVGTVMPVNALVAPLAMLAVPGMCPAYAVLLQLSAYVGCQITPTHLCISLSAAHFQASLKSVLLRSLPLYALIYGAGLLIYWIF